MWINEYAHGHNSFQSLVTLGLEIPLLWQMLKEGDRMVAASATSAHEKHEQATRHANIICCCRSLLIEIHAWYSSFMGVVGYKLPAGHKGDRELGHSNFSITVIELYFTTVLTSLLDLQLAVLMKSEDRGRIYAHELQDLKREVWVYADLTLSLARRVRAQKSLFSWIISRYAMRIANQLAWKKPPRLLSLT